MLRPIISRPVRLGVRRPSWTRDQFFSLLEFFFETVAVWYFVASSLTRGRVCNFLLLRVPASVVLLLSALSDERSGLSFIYIRYLHYLWYSSRTHIQYIQGIVQSRLGTADFALVTSNVHNNDSLDTWTVIHMTAAKFKPLIFSVSGFALSIVANSFIFMILDDFYLLWRTWVSFTQYMKFSSYLTGNTPIHCLQGPNSKCCLGKHSQYTVGTLRNEPIHTGHNAEFITFNREVLKELDLTCLRVLSLVFGPYLSEPSLWLQRNTHLPKYTLNMSWKYVQKN
jgi:hypothetical protein